MKKTNFDIYLDEQLADPVFAERFAAAGEAWEVAMQIAALREKAGLTQKELAKKLNTSQQQISRLESPAYEGHSLNMLRRVAHALNAEVKVVFEPEHRRRSAVVAEPKVRYGMRCPSVKGQFTMTALLERIENEAMALSLEDQERLVQDLIAGLERRPVSDIDQAWIDEAERRYDEMISGRVEGIPAEQVLRVAREQLSCRS